MIEMVTWEGKTLCYVIRAEATFDQTRFVTPEDTNFQMGFVVYPEGDKIDSHVHNTIERNLTTTSELLLMRKGRCEMDVFSDDRQLVKTIELKTGDAILILAGGHGFRLLEDTVFMEIKQGPYTGLDEKERF